MPVEFVNLPAAMHGAEQAQAVSGAGLAQDRAVQQAAAAQSQEVARTDQVQVQDPQNDRPENTHIREEERGGQPWHHSKYQGGPGPAPEEEKRPEDPEGRGKVVDLSA